MKDSLLWFRFKNSQNSFHEFKTDYVKFEPNYRESPLYPQYSNLSFEEAKSSFKKWLTEELKPYWEEQYNPDLWNHIQSNTNGFITEGIDYDSNEEFSESDKEEIKLALNEVKSKLLNQYDFTTDQIQLIEKRVLYLEENINNTKSKLDWKNLAVGAIFSLILNLSVDTEIGSQIWKLFLSIFENIPKLPV